MTLSLTAQPHTTQHPVSLTAEGIFVFEVPLVRATVDTLRGIARIVTDFETEEVDIVTWPAPGWRPIDPGTGTGGGITEGHFEFFWQGDFMYAHNHAVDGHYIIGWFSDPATASESSINVNRSRIYVHEANYHPDGGQVFYPCTRTPFVALLAPPGDDIRPEDFTAFYCDGTFGINLLPGVWHQPLYPLENHAVYEDKQGRVHACISVDFVREFGVYLSVPLRHP